MAHIWIWWSVTMSLWNGIMWWLQLFPAPLAWNPRIFFINVTIFLITNYTCSTRILARASRMVIWVSADNGLDCLYVSSSSIWMHQCRILLFLLYVKFKDVWRLLHFVFHRAINWWEIICLENTCIVHLSEPLILPVIHHTLCGHSWKLASTPSVPK